MYSRVTTAGMYKTLLGSLQGNLGNLQDLQRQMSSWDKYSKLSDNPAAISRSLEIKSALDANEKYQETSQNAVTMLKYSHGALNTALDAAETIRGLIVQAGNPALSPSELEDIADQIKAEKNAILDALNSKVAGQYIFGGTDTSTPPFTLQSDGSVKYNGSDERIKYALGEGFLGDVSFTGSEIAPKSENSYFICSHKVDLDWKWTGREEKVQITVGNRTLPVFIPEQWIDEVASGNTKSTDYNKFRDPGEVTGISLDDIASLINRSLEEQGADMLVKASVEKNYKTNEQQMILKSISGEKIGITGWTDTDYMPVPQTLAGMQFNKTGSTANKDVSVDLPDWDENVLGGTDEINLKNLNGRSITLMADNNSVTYAFTSDPTDNDDLVSTLNTAFSSLNITASVQNDKLILSSSSGSSIRASGSAVANLLSSANSANATSAEEPEYSALMGTVNVMSWRDDRMGKGINIKITDAAGNNISSEDFNFDGCNSISDLIADINAKMPSGAGDVPFASTVSGRLVLQSTLGTVTVSDISGGANGGAEQLFGQSDITSSKSSLSVKVGENQAIKIYINKDDKLSDIASKINAIEGVYSRASADNDQLVVVAQRIGDLPKDNLKIDEAQEALHYPKLTIEAEGAAKKLFDFNFETDSLTGIQRGVIASTPETRAVDHSHMDVFDVLGMETGMKSIEFLPGEKLEVNEPLHWRVMSGGHTADIALNAGEYTLTDLAERLKNAGAGWLEVTVDVFNPGSINQDEGEKGIATSYNGEEATQRLVIRGFDGEQVIFLDMNEQHYADKLGLSTALRAEPDMGTQCVHFPSAPCVDDRLGVKMRVQMNCGMSYDISVKRSDVIDNKTGFVDRVKVMREIVNQVNAQESENIMGISIPVTQAGAEIPGYASIYFLSGESFTVVDLPFSDPEWSDYSGGIAAQMGIHGGVTANLAMTEEPKADYETIDQRGTIRFSNLAHSVEIDVAPDDTVKSIMDRLRSQAGDWLYVNYYDTHMGQMADNGELGGRNSGDYPIIAISSVDGSAVSITDVKYADDGTQIAQKMLGLSTGVQGSETFFDANGDLDESKFWDEGATPGKIFSINVAGYTHDIDMTAMRDINGNGKLDVIDLAATINARMQDYDIQAEVNKDGCLVMWSPRGYSFSAKVLEVNADGTVARDNANNPINLTSQYFGGDDEQVSTYYRGGYNLDDDANTRKSPGIHSQNATIRSGANTTRQNAFGTIDDIISAVQSGNRDTLSSVMIPRLEKFIDGILNAMSSNGALQNRYDSNIERLVKDNLVMTDSYDKLVKIDPAEIASQMLMASYMYQANLSVISQLVQPSLLDFLR